MSVPHGRWNITAKKGPRHRLRQYVCYQDRVVRVVETVRG